MLSVTPTRPLPADAVSPAPFHHRGPLSSALLVYLDGGTTGPITTPGYLVELARESSATSTDLLRDDDVQLALFLLYSCSSGSLPFISAEDEWDPELIAARLVLEEAYERTLREVVEQPALPEPTAEAVAAALFELTAPAPGPSVARYLAKKATLEQATEFFKLRSIYTLREADPHSWAIPRLTGRAKAALVEIQSDEYGGGRPERVHATIFAKAMRGVGLSDDYAAYVDEAPALTLTALNMMSMFGMNRRLLGAIVGHLAAFEMTSSLPNHQYAEGLRRLGYGEDVTEYFDEHVEADAVHEQIAAHDLAGSLAEDRPDLLADIFFGAAACLHIDDLVGEHTLTQWESDKSALRDVPAESGSDEF